MEDVEDSSPPQKRPRVVIREDRNETAYIENVLAEADNNKALDLSPRGIRNAASALQKAINKNELQRAQYAEDPSQYMESELALYDQIEVLKAVAAEPNLFIVVLECDLLSYLNQLLIHDNGDIAAAVLAVWVEWFDSSILLSEDGEPVMSMVEMIRVLLNHSLDSIVGNLARLSQQDDQVGKGPEDVLTLVENLLDIDMTLQTEGSLELDSISVACRFCRETSLVSWLVEQVQTMSPYHTHCLDILALITPREDVFSEIPNWSRIPRYTSIWKEEDPKDGAKEQYIDALEILLQTVATFRKTQPEDETRMEVLENSAVIVACCLTFSPLNVKEFIAKQGVELVARCLKERVHAAGVLLKWLDFNGNEDCHVKACERVVEAGLLKYLVPLLQDKHTPKGALLSTKKEKKEWHDGIFETTVRVIYALTRHLTDDSPQDAKARLLAKFLDDDKCKRLAELIVLYDNKTRAAEYKFYRSEVEEELEDEGAVQLAVLSAKLAGGGDIFHRLGAIIAFCCAGSKRCHEKILQALKVENSGIGLVRASVEEFHSILDNVTQKSQLMAWLDHL